MRPDEAHRATDKQLAALERRIAKLYGEAGKEIGKTIAEYFEGFRKRDEEMRELIGTELNGREWTEQDYKQWRLNQIARGKQFEAVRDKIAERMTEANAVAVSYCNDETPGIYSLNRNYTAYTIEQVSDQASFDLWDERTVKRLIAEQPELMPYYPKKAALRRGIDLEYGKKQITASVMSGILQGKSIGHIADDLQKRMTDMDRASAIRTARTAVTGAQNAGRMDSYIAAQKMGIKMQREWMATLDNRTRHAHAMLDGQRADIDKPFKVDGYEIMFPGDKSAPGYLVYNCRCTLTAVVDGAKSKSQRRARGPETGENVLVEDMTYQEWMGWKASAKAVQNAADDAETINFLGGSAKNDLKTIVKRRTMKLENGFSCFPDGDVLSRYVEKVKPLKTYFDVAMHGTPDAVGFGSLETNMSARLLASVIRHSEGWNGQKIRLLSCSTGKQNGDDYCFAEELANALGVEVRAPNDVLFVTPNGNIYVGTHRTGKMVPFRPNQRGRRK